MVLTWIVLAVSLVADLISLIAWVRDPKPESRRRRLAWAFAVVLLTGLVVYQAALIQAHNETRREAQDLVASWPNIEHLDFATKGELIGVVLAGMQFLERHRIDYPETYMAAQAMVHGRLNDFRKPSDFSASLEEYGPLRDGAAAMIQLFQSIAGNGR